MGPYLPVSSGVSLITTFLLLLAAALGGGVIAIRFRLPSILGYIAGGIVVGSLLPGFFDHQLVEMVAQSGVTLLLFALGIEFSFHKLKRILHVIAYPAVGQILLTFFAILIVLLFFRISFVPALYLGAAAALSSTAIVVKLLSERGELESVPGEVATGWLVVQDLAVVPILILLAAVSGTNAGTATIWSSLGTVTVAVVKAGAVLAAVLYLGRHGIPKLLTVVSGFRNRELLLLTTIGIVFFVGLITYAVGLSIALGAFLAGLLVAETSQNHAVFAEIRPLRDLFAVIFFVSLGMSLPVSSLVSVWPVVLTLTVCVVVLKGLIVFGLLRFMGYHRKTAFLVGLYLTQVSEFGFILARAGMAAGVLSELHATILIAVTFLTIMISAPLISRSHDVYYGFSALMRRFPKFFRDLDIEHAFPKDTGYPIRDHVVLCGYGRVGRYIGRALQMAGVPFLVVDYNQTALKSLKESGIQTVYGDPADKEVLDYAQVDLARAIVVAIPDRHTQEMVIGNAVSLNRKIKIICRTHHEEDQRHLKSLGVATVVQPEFEAALTIVGRLLNEFGVPDEEIAGKMSRLKIEHGAG